MAEYYAPVDPHQAPLPPSMEYPPHIPQHMTQHQFPAHVPQHQFPAHVPPHHVPPQTKGRRRRSEPAGATKLQRPIVEYLRFTIMMIHSSVHSDSSTTNHLPLPSLITLNGSHWLPLHTQIRFYCNDCKKKFRSRILANRNNNAVQHYCQLYQKIITRKVDSHVCAHSLTPVQHRTLSLCLHHDSLSLLHGCLSVHGSIQCLHSVTIDGDIHILYFTLSLSVTPDPMRFCVLSAVSTVPHVPPVQTHSFSISLHLSVCDHAVCSLINAKVTTEWVRASLNALMRTPTLTKRTRPRRPTMRIRARHPKHANRAVLTLGQQRRGNGKTMAPLQGVSEHVPTQIALRQSNRSRLP